MGGLLQAPGGSADCSQSADLLNRVYDALYSAFVLVCGSVDQVRYAAYMCSPQSYTVPLNWHSVTKTLRSDGNLLVRF